MDAAGNVFEGYSDSFTVDSEAPVITFNGVTDKSANRGEISLDVSIDDVNISSDDISVSFSGAERGDLSANAGVLSSTDDGFKFTFGEFPEEQGIDDIYTVTVKAKDDAENYSEETLTFSVNRFGSNYYFDKSALEIAGTYVREPVDIVLHEINVDPLDMEKTMVTVMRDGNPKILEKDKDYELEVSGGDGSWCEYCYDIKAKNFSDDAAYNVVVMTEDAAGNLNANSEAGKKAEFKFGVDGTPPKCIPVNIETGCALRADRLTVNLKCEDNIMLDTLDVYVDDVHTEEQYVKGSPDFSFTLLSSDKPQTVRIDISDVAGNKTEMLIENILISTSFVKVAVRSVWTKAAACLAAAGGIAAFAVRSVKTRKRRKRLGL
jgi:hypothetical protein